MLARLAHGFSNAAIAAALSLALSEGTVKTHITGLIKLEARERLQAAVLAHRAGIVSPP